MKKRAAERRSVMQGVIARGLILQSLGSMMLRSAANSKAIEHLGIPHSSTSSSPEQMAEIGWSMLDRGDALLNALDRRVRLHGSLTGDA
jgi:hypothetical protein